MLSIRATGRRLDHQQRVFLGLTRVAANAATAQDHDVAAGFAELAARYASANHPATFSSPALETLLAGIGSATMPRWEWRGHRPSAGRPSRVLHVLTKAIGIGGHTRYALRWLERDAGSIHSLALTGQVGDVPPQLTAAVVGSGGVVRILGSSPRNGTGGGLVSRAAELRAIAAEADVVVVYAHPFDVVPVIALAGGGPRPPILFVNHADHCFWVGQAIADIVACIRGQGIRISTERRGIPVDRCALLPVPLHVSQRQWTREQAKEKLGVPSSTVLLVTVAAAYKYEPIDDVSFLDLVTPVLEAHPLASLLAIGPHGRRWRQAEKGSGGRIRALGPQPNVQLYYEACDIYLDAHPVSSVTSLLEAAVLGTPAMTLCPYSGGAAVLCSEDPGLDSLETRSANPADYISILGKLVENPGLREHVGRTTAATITSAHDPDLWKSEIETIYERLRNLGPVNPNLGYQPTGPGEPGPLDEVLCRIQSHPVLHPGLFADVYRERDHLPRTLRVREWANLAIDEAGRAVFPQAGLGRHRREQRFLTAAGRLTT